MSEIDHAIDPMEAQSWVELLLGKDHPASREMASLVKCMKGEGDCFKHPDEVVGWFIQMYAQALQPCELALLGHILNAELHGFHNEEFLTIQPVAPVVEEAT